MELVTSVLLSGATGFLGRHTVRRLQTAGMTMEAISLHGGTVGNVYVAAVDISSREQFFGWAKGKTINAIAHLAAAIPSNASGPEAEQSFKANVLGVLNVLALARERRCPVVYISGTSVYGANTNFPLGETALPQPQSLYVSSKYVGDVLCEQARMTEGACIATLRVSAPYGPGSSRRPVVNVFLQAALASTNLTLVGSGRRTQDFTYISDVTDAIYLSITSRASGIFNIASGRPVTMRQLAETVLEAVPESRSRIVQLESPDPQEGHRASFTVEKARQELGWCPQVLLLEGLKRTAHALKEATI